MENQNSVQNVVGEVQLGYKKFHALSIKKISTSRDVYKFILDIFPSDQINYKEHFYVIYLNNSNEVLGYQLLSFGGITSTIVDIRNLFQGALLINAVAMILGHNHPSGSTKPSVSDRELTDKINKASQVMDIQLLDHLIVTDKTYFSFADHGEI